MTPEHAGVSLCYHLFGEDAARHMAEKYGVRFEDVDLSEGALDRFTDEETDEDTC